MNALVESHFEYGWSTLKSGKRGKRWEIQAVTKVCPVVECEKCGRRGSPIWVRHWWMRPSCIMSEREYEYYDDPEPRLCMGCMNRLRRHWKTQEHIKECRRLIGRIKREITRVNAANRG